MRKHEILSSLLFPHTEFPSPWKEIYRRLDLMAMISMLIVSTAMIPPPIIKRSSVKNGAILMCFVMTSPATLIVTGKEPDVKNGFLSYENEITSIPYGGIGSVIRNCFSGKSPKDEIIND